jgi:CheY-like chemotaxis protein
MSLLCPDPDSVTTVDAAAPSSEPREPLAPRIELRGVKVLLVDDDLDTLAIIEAMIVDTGAEVTTAETVEQALAALHSFQPDVVVSDIGMPGCNGYQLIRMMRSRIPAEGGCTPAIALTGYTRDVDHTKALLAGYQVHLGKPVTARTLLETIQRLAAGRACAR